MNLERYPYFKNSNFLNYEFYSEGPKGQIKKSVRFTAITINDPIIYNLGFGDISEANEEIDDSVISNNHDRDIVLATVANIIMDFTNNPGCHYIFATGNTPSRTRLYQMGISSILEEIRKDFVVFGLKDDEWQEFQRNVNYTAFLINRN